MSYEWTEIGLSLRVRFVDEGTDGKRIYLTNIHGDRAYVLDESTIDNLLKFLEEKLIEGESND